MEYEINAYDKQRFHEGDLVLVWYPPHGADEQDRDAWAWLPGVIERTCGPDEWYVVVEAPGLGEADPDVLDGDRRRTFSTRRAGATRASFAP